MPTRNVNISEQQIKLERLRLEVQKGVDAYNRGDYIEIKDREELDAFFDMIPQKAKSRRNQVIP